MTDQKGKPLLVILLLYTLPMALAIVGGAFLGISLYNFLGLATIISAFGTIALFAFISKIPREEVVVYEEEPKEEIIADPSELEEALETIKTMELKEAELREEILFRNNEIQKLVQERDLERNERERLSEETMLERRITEEKIEEEAMKQHGLTENIANLKILLDRKQEEIDNLSGKIRDLTYEIKTLVLIADDVKEPFKEEEFRIHTPIIQKVEKKGFEAPPELGDDAKCQLRRCLDIAQKITGSHHIGGYQSRFRDMAYDNYALDLRRLCDSLRSEKDAAVIVYSPKEDKLLFINNHVKTLLGYSPEKFVQDFENIVQEGMGDWKKRVMHLTTLSEAKTSLIIKNRNNEDMVLQCLIGMIPTGVFKNHILGVLYQ